MKLIMCRECHDVIKLIHEERACRCGKSSGKYINRIVVEIQGPCVPIGIDNHSMTSAIQETHQDLMAVIGKELTAFVIPFLSPHVKRR